MTRAERVIAFIERHCLTPDGAQVGQPMRLAVFQQQFIRDIYDNPAGTRRAILSVTLSVQRQSRTAKLSAAP